MDCSETFFKLAELAVSIATLLAAVGAAAAAYMTYQKQGEQVSLLQSEMEDAREAARDAVRAVTPVFIVPRFPSRGIQGLEAKDTFHATPQTSREILQHMADTSGDPNTVVTRWLLLDNAVPESRFSFLKVRELEVPGSVEIARELKTKAYDTGIPSQRDGIIYLLGIDATLQDIRDGIEITFAMSFQTGGGHLVTQRYRYALGAKEIHRME
jgi:hypothetical protein